MFLQSLALFTSLAMAQTQFGDVPQFGDRFGLAATGPNITNIDLRAQSGRLTIGGTQTPSCTDNARQDFATFVRYSDNTTYLFTQSNPPQQVWVDASGMGQGITGYSDIDGSGSYPKNASFEDFEVDEEGGFTFNGVGAKACPTREEGEWSLWFTTSETPGFQDGCVDVELKAYAAPARVACRYTTQ